MSFVSTFKHSDSLERSSIGRNGVIKTQNSYLCDDLIPYYSRWYIAICCIFFLRHYQVEHAMLLRGMSIAESIGILTELPYKKVTAIKHAK